MSVGEESLTLPELKSHYGMTEGHCDQPVSDIHLEELSRTGCKQWKSLPPHLKVKTIVAEDIDKGQKEPAMKRYEFLLKWKEIKGSNATYRHLLTALLKINCGQDAEKLCEMLMKCVPQSQLPNVTASATSPQPTETAHQPTAASATSPQPTAASATSPQPTATASVTSHQPTATDSAEFHHAGIRNSSIVIAGHAQSVTEILHSVTTQYY